MTCFCVLRKILRQRSAGIVGLVVLGFAPASAFAQHHHGGGGGFSIPHHAPAGGFVPHFNPGFNPYHGPVNPPQATQFTPATPYTAHYAPPQFHANPLPQLHTNGLHQNPGITGNVLPGSHLGPANALSAPTRSLVLTPRANNHLLTANNVPTLTTNSLKNQLPLLPQSGLKLPTSLGPIAVNPILLGGNPIPPTPSPGPTNGGGPGAPGQPPGPAGNNNNNNNNNGIGGLLGNPFALMQLLRSLGLGGPTGLGGTGAGGTGAGGAAGQGAGTGSPLGPGGARPQPYPMPPAAAPLVQPQPAPKPAPPPAMQDARRVLVVNPAETNGPVNFAIDGKPLTLASGQVQNEPGKDSVIIEFDRGIGDARARYTLKTGTYRFSVTDKGWELYPTTYTVTLDNGANNGDFYYTRDGVEEVVPAGKAKTITGNFPVAIRFDRGDGGMPAERSLTSGTYKVGLTQDAKALDLLASRN